MHTGLFSAVSRGVWYFFFSKHQANMQGNLEEFRSKRVERQKKKTHSQRIQEFWQKKKLDALKRHVHLALEGSFISVAGIKLFFWPVKSIKA